MTKNQGSIYKSENNNNHYFFLNHMYSMEMLNNLYGGRTSYIFSSFSRRRRMDMFEYGHKIPINAQGVAKEKKD